MSGWSAVLLAGQRPGVDPLAAAHGVALKALLPVAGEAMAARVARTLLACPQVDRILVLAQDVAAIVAVLPRDARITVQASGAGIAKSVAAVAGQPGAPWPVLVTTADHVLLTPATIAAFLAAAGGGDVAVGVVERATVAARFPESRRTWLRFRGGAYTGANLFALNGPGAAAALAAWSGVEADRKKGWRLILRFGPWLLLRAATRTIGLQAALDRAGAAIGVRVTAVVLDDPLAAVDVDKTSDHVLAEAILRGER